MSIKRGMGPSLALQLREQHAEASGTELLRDGNMAEVGTAAWGPFQTVPSKVAVTPPANTNFTQALQLDYDGVNAVGLVDEVILSVGRTFRARGWLAGDGTAIPLVQDNGGAGLTFGTASALWQWVDVTFVATGTRWRLQSNTLGPGLHVRFTGWSIQEVLLHTWDSSDFCDSVSYLCSNRGGAQECLVLQKLEHVDRHTGAVTTVADFSASPGAGAVITPPTGWTYACASGSRTTQTSDSTLVMGLAANAAPWRYKSGNGGWSVESQRTNLCLNSASPTGVSWTVGTMPGVTPGQADPAGGVAAVRFQSTANTQYGNFQTVTAKCISVWALGVSGGPIYTYWQSDEFTPGKVSVVLPTWERYTTIAGGLIPAPIHTDARPDLGGVRETDIAFVQAEQANYASSYIPTAGAAVTRATATLTCPLDECNTHSGRIPRITVITPFAQGEALLDATVIDDSRGHLFYEVSTTRWVFEVRGKGRITSLPCTFARETAITLQADIDESTGLMTLVVSGCLTGNGTFQTIASPKRKVLVGDGFTAASFPAQQYPRGVTYPGTNGSYIRSLDMRPVGTSFSWVISFYMSALAISESGYNHNLLEQSPLSGVLVTNALYLFTLGDWLRLYSGTTAIINAAGVLRAGFRTAAAVADGVNASLYVDGSLVGGPVAMGAPISRSGLIIAGESGFALGSMHGCKVTSVKAYEFPLNATQLRNLHEQAVLDANRV